MSLKKRSKFGCGRACVFAALSESISSCNFFSKHQGAPSASSLHLERLPSSDRTKSPASSRVTSQRADPPPLRRHHVCPPTPGGHRLSPSPAGLGSEGQWLAVVGDFAMGSCSFAPSRPALLPGSPQPLSEESTGRRRLQPRLPLLARAAAPLGRC